MHRLLLPALLALSVLAPLGAGAASINGTLTGGQTFARPFANGVLPPTSPLGAERNYAVHGFTVDTTGPYNFLVTSGAFDSFLILYSPSFDPVSPLTNALRANDDLSDCCNAGFSGQQLTAGVQYFAVVSHVGGLVTGPYTLSITGTGSEPGFVTFDVAAVPAPAALAFFGLGLAGLAAVRRRGPSAGA